MRKQFTFYSSFFSALSRIKKKTDRADAYDIICAYALDEIEPDLSAVSDSVAIAFELLRPVLDKAGEKAKNGEKGGSKQQANDKQTISKQQANCKQTISKPEANRKQTGNKKEGEKEVEKEVEVEKEYYIPSSSPTEIPKVCGELPSSSPPAVLLPLIDGTDYPIPDGKAKELSELYPAVDVSQALRNMRGWLLANPKNRKTKTGIMRFVTAWLSREQDRARPGTSPQLPPRYGKPEIPKGASGQLGEAELEAIRRVMAQPVSGEEASYGGKLE